MNLKATDRALQLLEAAAICFARRGFHRTTMDEIAREAGVSAGLIYRHYASKDDLVVAMVEQHQQQELADIAVAAEAPTLAAALDYLLLEGLTNEDWHAEALIYAEVIAEALRNPRIAAVVQANAAALSAALAALLAAAQARGEIDTTLDPSITADLLLAFNDGLLLHNAFVANPPTAVELHRAALQSFYGRMLGFSAARNG